MNQYGLGLVLSLTDNLSGGVDVAVESINGLISSLERVDDTASTVSLMALCSVAQQVGDTFEDMGQSILGVFSSVFDKVMDTGSMFENYKVTLNALYGDAEKASDELSKMFSFAVTSPVDMENVMPYIVKLKTLGLEAFDAVSNKAQTTTQNMISWVTDFMSVASGMGASADRISRAVINFLNPENTRSLMMMRNIFGDIESLITQQGDTLANTVEGRVQNLTSIITSLGANGITESMMGNWSTMLSNMEDVFMQFWLGIADGGAFDSVKNSLNEIVVALNSVNTEKFGQVLADGLKIITVPLQKLAHWLSVAIVGFTDFAEAHPFLVKVAIGMTAVVGAGLILTGVVLKLGSQFGMLALGINVARNAMDKFSATNVARQFTMLGNKLKWLTLGLTALYVMWDKDFAGIKTKTMTFVNHVNNSFSHARSIISMNCDDMKKAIDALDSSSSPFDHFTKGLVKVGVLIGAVKEGLANRDEDGNFLISTNTYAEICELGLDGLVGRVFDAVYAFERFVDGFKTGWQAASDAVSGFISGFKLSIKGTFLDTLITKVADFADNLDFDREKVFGFFETLGEYAGKIAPLALVFLGLGKAVGGIGKAIGGIGGKLSGIKTLKGNSLVGTLLGDLGSYAPTLASNIGTLLMNAFKLVNPANIIGYAGAVLATVFNKTFKLVSTPVIKGINALFKTSFSGDVLGNLPTGTLGSGLSKVITKMIGAPIKGLLKVFSGLGGKVLGFLSNPFTQVIGLLTGVGTAFGQAYEHLDGFKEWVNESLGITEDLDFSTMFDGLLAGFEGMFDNLKTSLGDIISLDWLFDGINLEGGDGFLANLFDTDGLMEAINESFGGNFNIGDTFTQLQESLTGLWDAVSPVLAYLGVALSDFASIIWDVVGVAGEVVGILSTTIAPVLQGVVSQIVITFQSAFQIVSGIITAITGVVNIVVGVIQTIYGVVKGLVTGDWSTASEGITKVFEGVSSVFDGIKEAIGGVINFIKGTIGNFINIGVNIIDGIIQGVQNAWNSITEVFGNLVDHITQFVKDLLGIHSPSTVFSEIGTFIIEGLIEGVQSMFEGVLEFFKGLWDAITGFFNGEASPATFFSTIFQEAYDLVTGIFSTLGEFFSGVWDTIVGLFSNIGTAVGDAVSSTVTTAVNAVLRTAVSIINGFIGAINTAIGIINKIPGVSVSTLNKLNVPQMATGGVVDQATLAVVGEDGKEAVMPLENNTEWINKLALKIGSYMGVSKDGSYPTSSFVSTINDFVSTMGLFVQGITRASMDANNAGGLTTVINNQGDTNSDDSTVLYPTTTTTSYGGDSYNNTSNSSTYITRNNSTTSSGDVDNSVVFEKGSIVIQANGCSDAEAERLANLIIKKIERKKQIKNLSKYKSITE